MSDETLLQRLRWWFRWWLARWQARFRFRRDHRTVAQRLAAGEPLPGPLSATDGRLLLPPATPELPPESSTDFHSIPASPSLVTARPAHTFRVASTRILPPPPPELAVFRPGAWPLDPPSPPPEPATAQRPGPRALGLVRAAPPLAFAPRVRPELFGVDPAAGSTRMERSPPLVRRPAPRPSLRVNLAPRQATGTTRLTVLDPATFGLDAELRPALEANAPIARVPPPLPPAKANFRAKYIDPARPPESLAREFPASFGERIDASVRPRFKRVDLGAADGWKARAVPESLAEQLEEVHEQFLLRRDVEKLDLEAGGEDLHAKLAPPVPMGVPIKSFSGLEFVDLQPTPVKPLQMKLENAPPDMRPFVEPSNDALAALVAAIRQHREEPPVPILP